MARENILSIIILKKWRLNYKNVNILESPHDIDEASD
jgi:hypothetical protein